MQAQKGDAICPRPHKEESESSPSTVPRLRIQEMVWNSTLTPIQQFILLQHRAQESA